jgi:hypothetical protein
MDPTLVGILVGIWTFFSTGHGIDDSQKRGQIILEVFRNALGLSYKESHKAAMTFHAGRNKKFVDAIDSAAALVAGILAGDRRCMEEMLDQIEVPGEPIRRLVIDEAERRGNICAT